LATGMVGAGTIPSQTAGLEDPLCFSLSTWAGRVAENKEDTQCG
jgi:hypothetical protein